MSEEYEVVEKPVEPKPSPPDDDDTPIEAVARKATSFSREFIVTIFAVVSTAFGFVVALAWNTALSKALEGLGTEKATTFWLFVYAVVVTLLAVLVTILLGRLAARIGAQPVEFKIAPKSESK